MKQTKIIITLLLWLTSGLGVIAQNVITGTNLNIGENNTLSQSGTTFQSNAIGINNYLEGAHSLVVGKRDTILNVSEASVALGFGNKIQGSGSLAFGNNVKVHNMRGVGIGYYVKLYDATINMAIGSGLPGSTFHSDLFLENTYDDSLMIGFHSTKPTLTVGPSPNDYPNGNLTVDRTGKVAIGDVPVPEIAAKLHIRSDEGEDAGVFLEPKDLENSSAFIRLRDEGHGIEVDSQGIMRIKSQTQGANSKLILQGKVSVNTNSMNTSYSLCVKGGILTDKVKIIHSSDWPDYVFSSDYLLMPLSDLKAFVTEKHHLPDVPSENDIMAEGIEIGDMQSILLKKIEEMTLYILQQQEQIDKLEQRINELGEN